jgi:hypothetical protein
VSRTARRVELSVVFGVLPAVLALHARGLALPVLFIAAWVGLALLWRDPTFPRDQLWRREQLLTWLRGPLGLALGAGTLVRLGRWFVTGG